MNLARSASVREKPHAEKRRGQSGSMRQPGFSHLVDSPVRTLLGNLLLLDGLSKVLAKGHVGLKSARAKTKNAFVSTRK